MLSKFSASLSGPFHLLVFGLLIFGSPLTEVYAQERVKIVIEVTVTDDQGKPVVGAAVLLPRAGETNQNGEPLKDLEGRTDANGKFSTSYSNDRLLNVFQLGPSEHKIILTVPGRSERAEKAISNQQFLAAVQTRDKKLEVLISLPSQGAPVRKLTVTGKVTNEEGKPIPGAYISILERGTAGDGRDVEIAGLASDQKGNYQVQATLKLGGAGHLLVAHAEDFESTQQDIRDDALRSAEDNFLQHDFKLERVGFPTNLINSVPNFFWVLGLLLAGVALGAGGPWLYRFARVETNSLKESTGAEAVLADISKEVVAIRREMLTKAEFERRFSSRLDGEDRLSATGRDDTAEKAGSITDKASGSDFSHQRGVGRNHDTYVAEFEGSNQLGQTSENAALAAYRKLIAKLPVRPEPIYLDVEGPRSAGGKLEDSNVYLSQVGSSQGSMVLFSDGGNFGWVFPNPKVAFRPVAVKNVFPELTELEYEATKENFYPKSVRKIEEGRWQIERK